MVRRIKSRRRHKLSLKESLETINENKLMKALDIRLRLAFPVKADRLRYMLALIDALDKEIAKNM